MATAQDPVEADTAASNRYSTGKVWLLMTVVIGLGLANAFGALGGTILLGPTIQEDFNMSTDELQWLGTSFYIPLGCFSLVTGKLADIFGGKRMCLLGMAIFTSCSVASGFVKSMEPLFVCRGLSGLGSAMASTAGYPIIADIFPEGNGRTLGLALYIAAWPTGVGLGTVCAGFVAYDDWRKYFYLHGGLCGAVILMVLIILPDQHPDHIDFLGQIDWVGNVLVTVGVFLLLYVLSMAPGATDGWGTPHMIVLLILAVLVLGAFVAWEYWIEKRGRTPPLLPLGVFTLDHGRVSILCLVAPFNFIGFSGFMLLTTLYFQEYLELSLRDTAQHFIPGPISGAFCNILIGFIAPRVRTQWILAVGVFVSGLSLLLFAAMPVGASYWGYTLFAMMFSVVGGDFAGSAGLIYITQMVRGPTSGMAGGLFNTVVQFGMSMGPCIATLIFRYTSEAHARPRSNLSYDDDAFPKDSYLYGLKRAAWGIAGMCFFAAALTPFALRGMGHPRDSRKAHVESIPPHEQPSVSASESLDEEKRIEYREALPELQKS
ncbi:hypothetical protein FFLO_02283 [Filobasidium floriforme]|uniref:Major facilitator superfamily (MFS) profile domain-containing protein n=1 Tax=Filobasidium floriforme TaxID=5210 RepID=A0A8K0NRZ7_9TREE|nr:hypothetical protein FFLO_02283 [Filobasidium floriforme]